MQKKRIRKKSARSAVCSLQSPWSAYWGDCAKENELKINPRKLLAPRSSPAHLDRARPVLIAVAQEKPVEEAALVELSGTLLWLIIEHPLS